eukprot:FR740374.1.p1 GENE.FR740374.1~~FR740374.1.p1  ORF type:complete len:268 (+),score=8.75 FR740374.1:66-806(+)
MVKSGLEVDPAQRKEIRVSPYRLATHLCMVFTTYSLLVWTAMGVLYPAAQAKELMRSVPVTLAAKLPQLRLATQTTAGVVFLTAMSGAFVAGNDAGNAFNTWPDMDGQFIPEGVAEMSPLWRNAFENTATVQFDHRMLAYSSVGCVAGTYALARRGAVWALLPTRTRAAMNGMVAMVGVQAALGVSTLLLYVPISLAACHQAGSLVLLTLTGVGLHSLPGVPLKASHIFATCRYRQLRLWVLLGLV